MKIYLLFFSCVLINTISKAQDEFAPVGARWIYTWHAFGFEPVVARPYVVSVVGKENYQGHLCSKIELEEADDSWLQSPWYFYEENDSVFFWSTWSNQFQLLYDFTAEVGDTFRIAGLQADTTSECVDYLTLVVDSISFLVINDDTLKVWHISQLSPYCFDWGHTIIERIGSEDFLIPSYGLFEFQVSGVRCYTDSISDYQFVPYPCDTLFLWNVGTKDEDYYFKNISFAPNPVSNSLHLSSTEECYDCLTNIYNIQGQLMLRHSQDIPGDYDISSLSPGIYVCEVIKKGDRIAVMKFIKVSY
jgi:hypothetical protein